MEIAIYFLQPKDSFKKYEKWDTETGVSCQKEKNLLKYYEE